MTRIEKIVAQIAKDPEVLEQTARQVQYILENPHAKPADLHNAEANYLMSLGWTYGLQYDAVDKKTPICIEWGGLSFGNQKKVIMDFNSIKMAIAETPEGD